MLSTRVFGLACAVTVFVCLMAAPVSAQPLDKRTLFTFSGPVALPGVTLPAGQYLFRLADPNSSSKVVQVLNADGTKPYGLFFTIAAERLEPASSPEGADDDDRADQHGGTLAGRLERTGHRRLCERRANPGSSDWYNTRRHDRVVVALHCDTIDPGSRQCACSHVDGFGADFGGRNCLYADNLRTDWFCANGAHCVAANGKSASARCDGRHGRSFECCVAAVLAYATTVNISAGRASGSAAGP